MSLLQACRNLLSAWSRSKEQSEKPGLGNGNPEFRYGSRRYSRMRRKHLWASRATIRILESRHQRSGALRRYRDLALGANKVPSGTFHFRAEELGDITLISNRPSLKQKRNKEP
jgi:hypothetical protein